LAATKRSLCELPANWRLIKNTYNFKKSIDGKPSERSMAENQLMGGHRSVRLHKISLWEGKLASDSMKSIDEKVN